MRRLSTEALGLNRLALFRRRPAPEIDGDSRGGANSYRNVANSEGTPVVCPQTQSDLYVEHDPSPYTDPGAGLRLLAFYSPQSRGPGANFPVSNDLDGRLEPLLEGWNSDSKQIGKEVELAKHYGIAGFIVEYAYDGDLRTSIRLTRNLATVCGPDFSFCLSFRFDTETEIAYWAAFFSDQVRIFLGHAGYKRVEGRPLVVFESPLPAEAFAPAIKFLRWRFDVTSHESPYIVLGALSEVVEDPRCQGFDAVVQLAPHKVQRTPFPPREVWMATGAAPVARPVYSYASMKRVMLNRPVKDYPDFEAVYVGWNPRNGA